MNNLVGVCRIFLISILFTSQFMSQQGSFEKLLPGLGRYGENTISIIEFSEKGYIVAKEQESFFLFCIDLNGNLLWQKKYYENSFSVMKKGENLIVFLTDDSSLKITALSFNGLELHTKIIQLACYKHLTASSDNYLYVTAFSSNGVNIIKLDEQLNIIWKKDYLLGFLNPKTFFQSYEGSLFLFSSQGITKFDSSGTILFQKRLNVRYSTMLPNGKIFYSDYNGNLWELKNDTIYYFKNLQVVIRNLNYTNDNGFIICYDSGVLKLDEAGNIKWDKSFRVPASMGLHTFENSFIFSGYWQTYAWILKTNSDGVFNSINVYFPQDTILFYSYGELPARYITNVPFINAYVSYDNKNSWYLIKQNLPGDSGSFKWKPHFIRSMNCYMKITDASNELFYDETKTSFSYIIYKDFDYLAANQIKMWAGNNGVGSHDPGTDRSGFYWPGGENAAQSSIFTDGLVWGGKINSEVRVNGSTYRAGLTPGRIINGNTRSDPYDEKSRIFKIKNRWEDMSEGEQKEMIRADLSDWPGLYGAPYRDVDKNGVYTPGFDNPAYFGDETLFYIANDLDTAASMYTYGSLPMGLEFQTTIWGYDSSNYLKDAVFKKYLIINKGSITIDSMYLGYWSDDDLGFANDDFVGCDTNLNLGFTYNSDNFDQLYYNDSPPAVGHMILQGPILKTNENDSARFMNSWRRNYKNLNLTAFIPNDTAIINDPDPDPQYSSAQFYNNLKGLLTDGTPVIDPLNNKITKFAVPGDPETGEGWYEGQGWPGGPVPNDRRQLLSAGPFTFAPGDTQEIVIGILMARGSNNLNSVTELKNTAAKLKEFWERLDLIPNELQIIPQGYILYQNYPNPFNPATTIRYELPEWSNVELKVYDVLGREVITLINKEQPAGKYKVEINSGTVGNGLASGVYIYRLKTNNYISSKKMLLIK